MPRERVGDGPYGLRDIDLMGNDEYSGGEDEPEVLPKPYVVRSLLLRDVVGPNRARGDCVLIWVTSEYIDKHPRSWEHKNSAPRVADAWWTGKNKYELRKAKEFLLNLANVRY